MVKLARKDFNWSSKSETDRKSSTCLAKRYSSLSKITSASSGKIDEISSEGVDAIFSSSTDFDASNFSSAQKRYLPSLKITIIKKVTEMSISSIKIARTLAEVVSFENVPFSWESSCFETKLKFSKTPIFSR